MALEVLALFPGETIRAGGLSLELTEPLEVVGLNRAGLARSRKPTTLKAICPSGCELRLNEPYSVRVGTRTAEQVGLPLCPMCRTVMVVAEAEGEK